MNLKRNMKQSYERMEKQMNQIYIAIECILTGDKGIRQVDEHLKEFFVKFNEEASLEAEKFIQYNARSSQGSLSKEELLANNAEKEGLD